MYKTKIVDMRDAVKKVTLKEAVEPQYTFLTSSEENIIADELTSEFTKAFGYIVRFKKITSSGSRYKAYNACHFAASVMTPPGLSYWFEKMEIQFAFLKNAHNGRIMGTDASIRYSHPNGGSNGVTNSDVYLCYVGNEFDSLTRRAAFEWFSQNTN